MEPNSINPTPASAPVNPTPTPTSTSPAPSNSDHAFFQVQPVHISFAVKHAQLILIIGSIISLLIAAIGIIYQINYQATDDSGRNVAAIQSQIDQLDSEISSLAAKDQASFQTGGFSNSFYQSSTERTELELQKSDLQSTLDALNTANSSANIFNTGAIYFFLVALLGGIITITVFLVLRSRRPHSSSMIAD